MSMPLQDLEMESLGFLDLGALLQLQLQCFAVDLKAFLEKVVVQHSRLLARPLLHAESLVALHKTLLVNNVARLGTSEAELSPQSHMHNLLGTFHVVPLLEIRDVLALFHHGGVTHDRTGS